MIKHLVLLNFKPGISTAEVAHIFNSLGKLRALITEIQNYSWGSNNSPEGLAQQFTHAFSMDFSDAFARDRYLQHPTHQQLAASLILPALKDGKNSIVVIDYEYENT